MLQRRGRWTPDSMNLFKQLAHTAVRKLTASAPWGVRQAMLEGYLDHPYDIPRANQRVLRMLNITEIGADGSCGVITGDPNDRFVLLSYAAAGAGAAPPVVLKELLDFFGTEPGTYMDVGANIGLTTIPIARNHRIRCLAFEPEPVNFGHLKRNVARNAEGASVEFYPVALFDKHGTMPMSIAETNTGDHRLTSGAVSDRRMIDVQVAPLDDFIDRIEGRLALKVDTQGAEPFVVAGGQGVFARAGLISMEFCPYLMRQLGGDPGIVMDLVAGFDRVAILETWTPQYCSPSEARKMLENKLRTAADTDEDYLDILAVRS
jgi:FkbM family methyltransferase